MTAHRNSSWTGRAPRTLTSAFGPYCTGPVFGKPAPRRSVLADVLFAIALGIAGALLLVHWLSK